MQKGKQIYEGKAKILYETDDPSLLIQYFKDDATAFNAQKRGTIQNKGVMNNKISSVIFTHLEKHGVQTHFVKQLSDREMLVKKLEIVPVEVVMRNIVAGSLSKRMGIEEGVVLAEPVLEWYYKSDSLGDPMINCGHIKAFRLATQSEMDDIRGYAFKVNDFLIKYFDEIGIKLVDFKLEFGRHNGKILLGDEITPDGCRLWDKETNEKLDKDRFRRDLGGVEDAYKRVYGLVCRTAG